MNTLKIVIPQQEDGASSVVQHISVWEVTHRSVQTKGKQHMKVFVDIGNSPLGRPIDRRFLFGPDRPADFYLLGPDGVTVDSWSWRPEQNDG